MKHYLAIRKDEILPFVTTWVDLENIMLSKINQKEKVKNCMICILFIFKRIFFYFVFRETGREGEREGKKHRSQRF